MILELKNVESSYGLSQILFGVNLEVREGEVCCLLGRNGVGKSTTIKTIMGQGFEGYRQALLFLKEHLAQR